MKFENHKTYWCIAPRKEWNEEKSPVGPWQGELHINRAGMGRAWTMHPIDSLVHHYSRDNVDIISKTDLYHTEAEAKSAYIKFEVARLGRERIRIANEIIELMGYKNEI